MIGPEGMTMIGRIISHYPDTNRRDATKRRKIIEKLREGGMFQISPRLPACRRTLPPSLVLRRTGRQAGALLASGWKFENPPKRSVRRSTKCAGGSVGGGVV